jgi:hypothetical protein
MGAGHLGIKAQQTFQHGSSVFVAVNSFSLTLIVTDTSSFFGALVASRLRVSSVIAFLS